MTRPIVNPYKRFLREELRTYWECRDRKGLYRQLSEAYALWRAYDYFPYQYVQSRLYDRNCAGDVGKYVPTKLVQGYRNELNPPDARAKAHDKSRFYAALAEAGIHNFPPTLRTLSDGRAQGLDGTPMDKDGVDHFLSVHGPRFFVKPVLGSLGRGTRILDFTQPGQPGPSDLPDCLVQALIVQHDDLMELYPHSVNTIRIDTWITDEGDCIHNAAVQRMGMNGEIVDNWARGGVATGIDLETGLLFPRGRRKNKYADQTIYDRHPETGTVFAGRRVPYWDEVKALTARAARVFLPLRSLGWDVAITAGGPVLVEANVGWHVDFMQQIWGGLADTPLGQAAVRHHRSKTGRRAS